MNTFEYLQRQKELVEKFSSPAARLFQNQLDNLNSPFNRLVADLQPFRQFNASQKVLQTLAQLQRLGQLSNEQLSKFNSLVYREFDLDFFEGKDETNKQIVIDETKHIRQIISDIYNNSSVLDLISPFDFEKIIAEILARQGFRVELTKQTRDNGYDIIAIKQIGDQAPLKFLVECKKFTKRKVGIEIIRSFKEVVSANNVNRGILVTSSYFTSVAKKKREETPYLLDYRDKDDVIEWVKNYNNPI